MKKCVDIDESNRESKWTSMIHWSCFAMYVN